MIVQPIYYSQKHNFSSNSSYYTIEIGSSTHEKSKQNINAVDTQSKVELGINPAYNNQTKIRLLHTSK